MSIAPHGSNPPAHAGAPARTAQWRGASAPPPSEHRDDHRSGAAGARLIPDQAPGMPSPALVG
jgi:hypothetical protein